MQDFRKLKVWEKSHSLTLQIYRVTQKFPREEVYGITAQLRRCVTSIPANIAEATGKNSGADLARILQIAMGSACETEYYLTLACDLKYLSEDMANELISKTVEIKKMLTSFIKKLRTEN